MFNIDDMDKPVNLGDGEWVKGLPGHPGVELKVRTSNYKPFTSAHNALLRGFGRNAGKAMDSPEYLKAVGELLAKHILLDWKNAVHEKGKPLPYSEKLALKILTSVDDRAMGQTFRDAVTYAASAVAERLLGVAEDIAGN